MTKRREITGADPASVVGSAELARASVWCRAMLPRVSRTFALSIDALPPTLEPAVRTAYLLCRIVDSIEDGRQITGAERQALFDLFDAALANDSRAAAALESTFAELAPRVTPAETELCRRAGRVFVAFGALAAPQRDAIRPPIEEMSRGMREYAGRGDEHGLVQLCDLQDLERYCYFVAGTVGKLLTALFCQQVALASAATRRALEARARSFGIGLQLVNILKDAAVDHHHRRARYLPLSVAEHHRLDLERLLDPAQRAAGLQAVRSICGVARRHLDRAAEYTALWPATDGSAVRRFCVVPLALALATLRLLEEGSQTLRLDQEPKVSRRTVTAIISEADRAATDDAALARMLARYGKPRLPTDQRCPSRSLVKPTSVRS